MGARTMTPPGGNRAPRAWARLAGWLLVASALGPLVALSYLGGLLDPDRNTRNLPLAIVVEDRGAAVGSQTLRLGEEAAAAIEAGSRRELGDRVRWRRFADRAAAVRAIEADTVYAAVVIPADFSRQLLRLAQPSPAPPPGGAQLTVLANPAAGSYAGTYAQSVATGVTQSVTRDATARLTGLLSAAKASVPAAWAARIGQPITTTVQVVRPVRSGGGRGLAPFYFAVVVTLGGVLAASTLNITVDVLAGRDELRLFGRAFRYPRSNDSLRRSSRVKLAGVLVAAPVSALASSAIAFGVVGMPADRPWTLVAFAVLVATAMALVTLAATEAFGVAGSVFAVFLTTIVGVPSAGGVYPLEATPTVFRGLAAVLPLRYATDGARSLIFFDGAGPSVRRAVIVLAVWLVAGLAAGRLAAFRHARTSDDAGEPESPATRTHAERRSHLASTP